MPPSCSFFRSSAATGVRSSSLIARRQRRSSDQTGRGLDGPTGDDAINAAFYFPWVTAPNPLQENRPGTIPPCGFVAGLYARTDATRGVWKAPAGTEASLAACSASKSP